MIFSGEENTCVCFVLRHKLSSQKAVDLDDLGCKKPRFLVQHPFGPFEKRQVDCTTNLFTRKSQQKW